MMGAFQGKRAKVRLRVGLKESVGGTELPRSFFRALFVVSFVRGRELYLRRAEISVVL